MDTTLPASREGQPQIAKVRYTHDGMIDLMIQNPWISQGDIAKHFGYTQSWISTVVQSDAFQARMAARREEVVDPVLRLSLEERFRAMVTRSLEVLQQKLSVPAAAVPDNLALRAVELGAKALGIGGNAPPKVPVQAADYLEVLAGRLIALQSNVQKGNTHEVLEVETREVCETKEAGEGAGPVRTDSGESNQATC